MDGVAFVNVLAKNEQSYHIKIKHDAWVSTIEYCQVVSSQDIVYSVYFLVS